MNWKIIVPIVALFCLGPSIRYTAAQSGAATKSSAAPNSQARDNQAGAAPDGQTSRFSIRGTVVDEAGAPVANAEIAEIGPSRRRTPLGARSDAGGNFTLTSPLPNFRRWLIARDNARGRLGLASCVFDERSKPVRIVLLKGQEIAASVTDGRGRPVSNAKVAVVWQLLTLDLDQRLTDAAGKTTLRVPAGLPLDYIFAVKEGVGFDYFIFRQAKERAADPAKLAPDDPGPIKFVLGGAQRVRVHVVDENHSPLAGIRICVDSIARPYRGGSVTLNAIDEWQGTTNAAGMVELRTIPFERGWGLRLSSGTPGYEIRNQPIIDHTAPIAEVQMVVRRIPVLRAQVTFADGRPAAGARLSEVSRTVSGNRIGTWDSLCDEQGTSQFPESDEDSFAAMAATTGHFASQLAGVVVRKGRTVPPVHFVLRPAARVHGTVTTGKDRRPIADADVTLYQRVERAWDDLPARERPDGATLALSIPHHGKTDEQGRFEFFARPGRYWLIDHSDFYLEIIGSDMTSTKVLLDEGANEFEVTNQSQIEVNLHHVRPQEIDFDGRVVLSSDRQQGVPGAVIQVSPLDLRNSGSFPWARSGPSGEFHSRRRPCEMLVEARSADRTRSGIVRVFADETNVTIPIGPGASARGVLINASTGEPVANLWIVFGIRVECPGRGFTLACQRWSRTNEQGKFELRGLTPGSKFELYAIVQPSYTSKAVYSRLGDVAPEKPNQVELGQFKLPAIRRTPEPAKLDKSE